MLIAPLPLVPYHHLARTASNRWWKTLLGFVLVPGVYLALALAATAALLVSSLLAGWEEATGGPLLELALTLSAIAALLPIVLLVAWWTQGRRPGTLSSVRGRLRWRWLLVCAALAVPATLLSLGSAVGLTALSGGQTGGEDYRWVGLATFVPALLIVLALVPLQAAAEEYLCRGWLLQSVAAFVPWRWVAIGAQSLVFALLHGVGTPWGFADLVVFAAVTGWLAIRTGGLEAGIALHAVNNVLAFALAAGAVGGLAGDESAADSGWELAVGDIAVILAYGLLVRWLATRLRIDTAARGAVELAVLVPLPETAPLPTSPPRSPSFELSPRTVPAAAVRRAESLDTDESGTDLGPVRSSRSSVSDVDSSAGR